MRVVHTPRMSVSAPGRLGLAKQTLRMRNVAVIDVWLQWRRASDERCVPYRGIPTLTCVASRTSHPADADLWSPICGLCARRKTHVVRVVAQVLEPHRQVGLVDAQALPLGVAACEIDRTFYIACGTSHAYISGSCMEV